MHTQKLYLKAIQANLLAIHAILKTVMQDIEHGLEAAEQGNQNGAVGAIVPTDQMLRQAGTLVQAIFVLHRQN